MRISNTSVFSWNNHKSTKIVHWRCNHSETIILVRDCNEINITESLCPSEGKTDWLYTTGTTLKTAEHFVSNKVNSWRRLRSLNEAGFNQTRLLTDRNSGEYWWSRINLLLLNLTGNHYEFLILKISMGLSVHVSYFDQLLTTWIPN